MAPGVHVLVGIVALQIVTGFVAGQVEITTNCRADSHAVAGVDISVGDLCWGEDLSASLENAANTALDLFIAFGYRDDAGNFKTLKETSTLVEIANNDISATLKDLQVQFSDSFCSNAVHEESVPLVLQITANSEIVYEYTFTTVKVHCSTPDIYFDIDCSQGLAIYQGTSTDLEEFCQSEQFEVMAWIPKDWPLDDWKVFDGDTKLLSLSTTSTMQDDAGTHWAVDLTEDAKSWSFTLADGACNNRKEMVSFSLKNGVFSTWARLSVTALCSFAGVDMKIEKIATTQGQTSAWVVNDGDLSAAWTQNMDAWDFEIDKSATSASDTAEIPQLTSNDETTGVSDETEYMVTAFLTRKRASDITKSQCEVNNRIVDINATDTVVCNIAFKSTTYLSQVKMELKRCLQSKSMPNICGRRTLVILVDSLRSMNGEKRCNNFITYDLECVCTTEGNGMFQVVPNPFSQELAVIYRSGDKDKFFAYDLTWNGFRRAKPGDPLERIGYGRLLIILSYIDDKVQACMADTTEEPQKKLEALEGLDGETSLQLPTWMGQVESIISKIKNYDLNEMPETEKQLITDEMTQLLAFEEDTASNDQETASNDHQALSGMSDALQDILNKHDSTKDMCHVIYQLDHDTYNMAHGLGYMFLNLTLLHGQHCTKIILAEYLQHKKSPVDDDSENCKPKLHRCINKIKRHCHGMNRATTDPEIDINNMKESLCKTFEMKKLMKKQGNAIVGIDLEKLNAKQRGHTEDICESRRLAVKDTLPSLWLDGTDELKFGRQNWDNTQTRLYTAAIGQCTACSDSSDGTHQMFQMRNKRRRRRKK